MSSPGEARRGARRVEASHVAIDLGAASGRVFRGRFGADQFELEPIHRFDHEPRQIDGALRWSTADLLAEIKSALAWVALSGARVASLGLDAWGCDYGLLDAGGRLLEEPIAYRDPRTDGVLERVVAAVPREEIHRATGVQLLPFNTLFQLHAHVHGGRWPKGASRLLTLPGLFHHALCGSDSSELTHATTTQMVRHDTRDWDRDLLRKLSIPSTILPPIVPPGTRLGPLKSELARDVGLQECEVVAVGTHDTASAVAGTPLSDGVAFVSSGTWSHVGVELPAPLVNDETLREDFGSEAGVAGTTRFLKSVAGMWLLEGCRKSWKEAGADVSWEELERQVERAPAWGGVIAPDDPLFFRPTDMVAEIRRFLRETRQPAPESPGAIARIVLESLALRYADVLETIARLTGRPITTLRIVGGGSRHEFLNQATADVTGLEVLAGPVDAAAIGNLLVQAIAAGRFRDLAEGRAYVAHVLPAPRFVPRDPQGLRPLLARFRRMTAARAAR